MSLGGELRQTRKLLPALVAGSRSGREVILPIANALEANLVGHANLKLANHLLQVCDALRGKAVFSAATCPVDLAHSATLADTSNPASRAGSWEFSGLSYRAMPDLAEVRGQFAIHNTRPPSRRPSAAAA